MYDELVKRLRSQCQGYGKECEDCNADGNCRSQMENEAADAIEELSEYVNTMRKLKCEGWYLQQIKFHDGYHAMAQMPLPEPPKEGE